MEKRPMTTPPIKQKVLNIFSNILAKLKNWKKNSSYQKKNSRKNSLLWTLIVSFCNPPKRGWVFRKT
jgi:hypothetical protein